MKLTRKPLAWTAAGALAVSILLGSLTGCGSSASTSASSEEAGIYTAGTYTSTAGGFGGDITVKMTFSASEITDVAVEGPGETEGIGSNAVEQLPEKIKEAQSAEVDAIAGCTVSSNAILAAAKDCIAQATGKTAEGYKAGTYTETVSGRNAAITVDVVLSETAVEKVLVTDHSETASVADVALERIPAAIVQHQTTKVDNVTGATVTSNAIKQAVNNAIAKAGGNAASLPEAYSKPGTAIEDTADIVVVGGGGAGMSAATAALQEGASVILVEKTSMLGGNTVLCGGAMNAADTEWSAQYEAQTGETDALQELLALDESAIAPEYLEDFRTLKKQIKEYLAGDTSKHFDSVELHTIQTYYYGTRSSLDNGTIYGEYDLVSTMTNKAMETVDWLAELGVQWKDTVTQPVGAMWRRGHNPGMPKGTEYVDVLGSAIQNQGGKIYYETTAHTLLTDDTGAVCGVECVQADGTKVTLHCNKAVILATGGYANNLEMVQDTNNYWPSIPDDTQQTQNFLEAIETYNGYVDAGEDPDFGKTSFAFKVEQGPFFATPRKPALHHTMGGLSIDTGAHVLDTQGNPIPGLYAAGEVTGGIHGGNRLGGNAVADCLTFGRIAGTNAAAE